MTQKCWWLKDDDHAAQRLSSCGCSLEHRTYLKVGEAIVLRNRLQRYLRESTWIYDYLNEPHGHLVFVSAWYVPKNELEIAESALIAHLKPVLNEKKTGPGFGGVWTPRPPDVLAAGLEDLMWETEKKPSQREMKRLAQLSPIKRAPAVYAWWVDPVVAFLAASECLRGLPARTIDHDGVRDAATIFAARIASAEADWRDAL